MAVKERKIREHRFLNKYTIPGVLLLMLGAPLKTRRDLRPVGQKMEYISLL